MSEVLHANIFFFITGIAVILFTALLCVVLYHIIKAVQALRRILERIEEGTEIIAEDMQSFRSYFTGQGIVKRLVRKLMGNSSRRTHDEEELKVRRKRKAELEDNDETN